MKKIMFSFFVFFVWGLQVQAQQMALALYVADFCVNTDTKTAMKALKEQGFKKLTKKGDTIYYLNKKEGVGAMLVSNNNYVDYVKFLFNSVPSTNDLDEAAWKAGYKRMAREGRDRYYRKKELALYASEIQGNPDYTYGFVIKYEP